MVYLHVFKLNLNLNVYTHGGNCWTYGFTSHVITTFLFTICQFENTLCCLRQPNKIIIVRTKLSRLLLFMLLWKRGVLRYRQSKRVLSSEKPQPSARSEVFDIFCSGQSTNAGSTQAVRNVITMNNCTIWKTPPCNCCNRHTHKAISKSFWTGFIQGLPFCFSFTFFFPSALLNTLRHIQITPLQIALLY